MPRDYSGGTKMHCPRCLDIAVCTAIPLTRWNSPGKFTRARNLHKTKHPDISWFRRARECQRCGHEFVTAEVDEQFITELVDLRDALGSIRMDAEHYLKEASEASVALQRLNNSLNSLTALKMYKQS